MFKIIILTKSTEKNLIYFDITKFEEGGTKYKEKLTQVLIGKHGEGLYYLKLFKALLLNLIWRILVA